MGVTLDNADNLVGQCLQDRYQILSELGRGGMGTVYLADDLRLHRQVVVKIPHPSLMCDADMRRRFLYEVEHLTQYEHPHIVRIQDFGEHQGLPYAVVQYVAGGSLGDRLAARREPQTTQEVLEWLPDIAAAVDAVHARGAVHRDVKPANILFDERGHAFLADFGIATAMQTAEGDATVGPDQQLTRTGAFIGSGLWAPPEAIDRVLSPRYDVYSLGVVVYEALSGARPFKGQTSESILFAKRTEDPVPLGDCGVDVPKACARVVMRAIARDPGERYPSCEVFAQAFGEAAASEASVGAGWRRAPVALAATALAAAAVVAVVWWNTHVPPRADRPAVVRFLAGSTPDEIGYAMALCRAHRDDCDDAWYASERLREVEISPIELDRTEVTNADFTRFVESTGYLTDAERRGSSYHGPLLTRGLSWREPLPRSTRPEGWSRHPVVHVSFRDAVAYCAAVGGRLPTEEEWEFVARGRARRIFPWGDAWDPSRALWRGPGTPGLLSVGSHPGGTTPQGHRDLAGSVWEWTSSVDGRRSVLKGGSWRESNPANLRAAARLTLEEDYSGSDVGFRCVRDVREWP